MAIANVETWTKEGFVNEFMHVHHKMEDRSFAFFLGAGSSVSSRIHPGGVLAKRWLVELYRRHVGGKAADEAEVERWARQFLSRPDFALADVSSHYSTIYETRFARDPNGGYADLEDAMKDAEPSIGYSILALILAKERHKVVITTNFDNLVADALSIYTDKSPLVCGHESLAGFARVRLRRPLIAKIHRDLLYAPKNTIADTEHLAKPWEDALGIFFDECSIVVIGYGGNDGSVMEFFESRKGIPNGLFWCYREVDGPPNARIQKLVAKLKGVLIPIPGFDELMILLGERLGYPLQHQEILNRASERAKRYREQYKQFQKRIEEVGGESTADVKDAVAATSKRSSDWWSWDVHAKAEKDPEKREAIYREGMRDCPESPELIGNFANFLWRIRKDYDGAERFYRKVLELDPQDAEYAGNYAAFLIGRKRFPEARGHIRRAWMLNENEVEQSTAEIGLYTCLLAEAEGRQAGTALTRLRFVLEHGFIRLPWSFDDVLAATSEFLGEEKTRFYRALADAILDETRVGELEEFERWRATTPVPLSEPWDPLA